MDMISNLPEELLLRIFSLQPAKDVVDTMVLSTRWKFLWKLVQTLKYDHNMYQDGDEYKRRFSRFVYSSLLLHEAPVLKILDFKLDQKSSAIDVGVWVRTAVNRCVIDSPCSETPVILPWSLYTGGCRTLVVLNLSNIILVDASSLPVSFPSLKGLRLVCIKYPSEEFLDNFLSSCLGLEQLIVEQCPDDNVTVLTVRLPSLNYLHLLTSNNRVRGDAAGFVIDAPSLKRLDIFYCKGGFCVIENEMPDIVEAYVDVTYSLPGKILSSIISVERLVLCLSTSKDAYPVGSIFERLVYFEICTCETEWLNLLMRLLKDSPNLRALKLDQCHELRAHKPRPCWNEPSSVPECLSNSVETVEWVDY